MSTAETQAKKDVAPKSASNEEILKKLISELEDIFAKDKIESNPELIFKMNQNLEIPITAIYKEKRILAITTNLALIREALEAANNVVYDKQKEVVRPNIKAQRNILIVNKIEDSEKETLFKTLSTTPEYTKKISENFFDNINSYTLVLQNEQDAQKLYNLLKQQTFKSPSLEIVMEQENIYLTFLQKAQDTMRYSYQNYSYGGGYGRMDPSMYYQNYYYGGYQQPYFGMSAPYGGGYSKGGQGNYYYDDYYGQPYGKKGQAGDEDYEEGEYDEGDDQDYKYDRNYQSRSYRSGRGGASGGGKYYKKKAYGGARQYKEYEKKQQQPTTLVHQKSHDEIIKRTRLDSENFPPLGENQETHIVLTQTHPHNDGKNYQIEIVEERMSELKHGDAIVKVKKNDILNAYKALEKKGVKINPGLAQCDEELVPILEKGGEPSLEAIHPKVIVREPRSRKQSTVTDGGVQRSPFQSPYQGALDRRENP